MVTLMVMVYVGGHISGAHYNPAVTIAIWLRGKLDAKDIPLYLVSQIVGAFAAAVVVYLFKSPQTFAPQPGDGFSAGQVLLAEFLFTFALCLVILTVATSDKLEGNNIYGLAIGMTVTAGAICVGPISGGCFNPAVFIGPGLMHLKNSSTFLTHLPLYLIGPIGGGVVAVGLFRFLDSQAEAEGAGAA